MPHHNPLYYIRFTPEDALDQTEVGYWGPFPKDQLRHRLNDAMAVDMEEAGTVDAVPVGLVDPEAFINSPEAWIAAAIEREELGEEE